MQLVAKILDLALRLHDSMVSIGLAEQCQLKCSGYMTLPISTSGSRASCCMRLAATETHLGRSDKAVYGYMERSPGFRNMNDGERSRSTVEGAWPVRHRGVQYNAMDAIEHQSSLPVWRVLMAPT